MPLHTTRNNRRVRKKAAQLPDTVITDSRRTANGSRKLWYYHNPCDDGGAHSDSDGFIQVRKPDPDTDDSPENFVFKCSGCGATWDYIAL